MTILVVKASPSQGMSKLPTTPPFLDWKFDADEREWIASCLNNPAFRVYCSVWIYIDHYQYHVAVWSNGTLLHDLRGHAFTLTAAKIAAEKAAFC